VSDQILQAPRRHPIAPTKFPTGLAATQEVRRWRRHRSVQHEPRKRRIPATDHAGSGYLLGLTPELLLISVASGQLSTASIRARQQADGSAVASVNESTSACLPTYTLLTGLSRQNKLIVCGWEGATKRSRDWWLIVTPGPASRAWESW